MEATNSFQISSVNPTSYGSHNTSTVSPTVSPHQAIQTIVARSLEASPKLPPKKRNEWELPIETSPAKKMKKTSQLETEQTIKKLNVQITKLEENLPILKNERISIFGEIAFEKHAIQLLCTLKNAKYAILKSQKKLNKSFDKLTVKTRTILESQSKKLNKELRSLESKLEKNSEQLDTTPLADFEKRKQLSKKSETLNTQIETVQESLSKIQVALKGSIAIYAQQAREIEESLDPKILSVYKKTLDMRKTIEKTLQSFQEQLTRFHEDRLTFATKVEVHLLNNELSKEKFTIAFAELLHQESPLSEMEVIDEFPEHSLLQTDSLEKKQKHLEERLKKLQELYSTLESEIKTYQKELKNTKENKHHVELELESLDLDEQKLEKDDKTLPSLYEERDEFERMAWEVFNQRLLKTLTHAPIEYKSLKEALSFAGCIKKLESDLDRPLPCSFSIADYSHFTKSLKNLHTFYQQTVRADFDLESKQSQFKAILHREFKTSGFTHTIAQEPVCSKSQPNPNEVEHTRNQEELTFLRRELGTTRELLDKEQTLSAQAKNQVKALQTQLTELTGQIEQKNKFMAETEEKIKTLQTHLEKSSRVGEKCVSIGQDVNEELKKQKIIALKALEQIKTLEAQLQASTPTKDHLNAIKKLEDQNYTQHQNLMSVKGQLKLQKTVADNLKKQMETQLKTFDEKIQKAEDEATVQNVMLILNVEEKREELEKEKAALTQAKQDIENLKGQLKTLEEQHINQKSATAEAQNQIKSLQDQLKETKKSFEGTIHLLQTANSRLNQKFISAIQNLEKNEIDRTQSEEEIQLLTTKLETEKENHQAALEELKTQISTLETELNTAKANVEEAQQEIQTLETKLQITLKAQDQAMAKILALATQS